MPVNPRFDTHAIHAYGAQKHGVNWLIANETAIHAASRLGVDYTKPENKQLLSLVTLHIMETFMNTKSPYCPVKRVDIEPAVSEVVKDESNSHGRRSG